MCVKGTDLDRSADIDRHHQPVAGDASGDNSSPLRQYRRDVGRVGASLGAEKTVADGNQDGRMPIRCLVDVWSDEDMGELMSAKPFDFIGAPKGNRTPVSALRGPRPNR